MPMGLVKTAVPARPIQSAFALAQHMRADPVPVQVVFQKTAPTATFEKCNRATDREQSKNENTKCLHPFEMGLQTAKFKNGVARC